MTCCSTVRIIFSLWVWFEILLASNLWVRIQKQSMASFSKVHIILWLWVFLETPSTLTVLRLCLIRLLNDDVVLTSSDFFSFNYQFSVRLPIYRVGWLVSLSFLELWVLYSYFLVLPIVYHPQSVSVSYIVSDGLISCSDMWWRIQPGLGVGSIVSSFVPESIFILDRLSHPFF